MDDVLDSVGCSRKCVRLLSELTQICSTCETRLLKGQISYRKRLSKPTSKIYIYILSRCEGRKQLVQRLKLSQTLCCFKQFRYEDYRKFSRDVCRSSLHYFDSSRAEFARAPMCIIKIKINII